MDNSITLINIYCIINYLSLYLISSCSGTTVNSVSSNTIFANLSHHISNADDIILNSGHLGETQPIGTDEGENGVYLSETPQKQEQHLNATNNSSGIGNQVGVNTQLEYFDGNRTGTQLGIGIREVDQNIMNGSLNSGNSMLIDWLVTDIGSDPSWESLSNPGESKENYQNVERRKVKQKQYHLLENRKNNFGYKQHKQNKHEGNENLKLSPTSHVKPLVSPETVSTPNLKHYHQQKSSNSNNNNSTAEPHKYKQDTLNLTEGFTFPRQETEYNNNQSVAGSGIKHEIVQASDNGAEFKAVDSTSVGVNCSSFPVIYNDTDQDSKIRDDNNSSSVNSSYLKGIGNGVGGDNGHSVNLNSKGADGVSNNSTDVRSMGFLIESTFSRSSKNEGSVQRFHSNRADFFEENQTNAYFKLKNKDIKDGSTPQINIDNTEVNQKLVYFNSENPDRNQNNEDYINIDQQKITFENQLPRRHKRNTDSYTNTSDLYIDLITNQTESFTNIPHKNNFKINQMPNSNPKKQLLKRQTDTYINTSSLYDDLTTNDTLDTTMTTTTKVPVPPGLKVIYIGGLFELSDSPSVITGRSELAAAKLAIQHVNRMQVIPGYHLHMYSGDTKCDPGYGADVFYDMMYKREQLLMLIATSCSEVAKMLGEIVPYWNLVMVSHAATSPALSDREKYPGFFRLAAADSSHNPARRSFIQHFGWNTVATLIQDIESFSLANNEMTKGFEAVNISVKATLSFWDFTDDLHAKMIDLKESDARIIIGSFQEDAARYVFCEAYKLGIYGSRYVWMLLGSYPERWWTYGNTTNCTDWQLEQAVEGHFTVDSLTSILGNGKSVAGLTTAEFLEEYSQLDIKSPRSMYAQLAYDSVWAISLTLKATLEEAASSLSTTNPIDDFSYKSGKQIYKSFVKHMDSLDFTGVSGPVSFAGSDRRGVSVIEQNQRGQRLRVALFYPENSSLDFNCVGCESVIWQGKKIPVDKMTKILREERILDSAFLAVCVASLSGMVIAFAFLGFNLHYRKLKYIKLSSPQLNNVAAVGCVFVYMSVILLGVDDRIIPHINYIALCMGRAYLWVAGFSLAFGAMFAKTYRVHQIFRRANAGIVRSKLLKDSQLLLLLCGLLILDTIVMTLWIVIDPMEREVRNLSAYPSPDNPDLVYIPQLSRCNCTHLQKWMGSLYAYKGMLLLFGVYMAWETRHVQIPALNDSQYIGMNIYNVVLSSVTVVVVSTGLTDKPTLSFALISTLIIVSTTGMLGLLFFPKIYDICKNKGSPIVTTAGMTFEGNTRRFLTDERKEKYYRAEVENRFLKRKLTQLDQEIARLERLLQLPIDGYLKATEDTSYLLPSSEKLEAHDLNNQQQENKNNIFPDSQNIMDNAAVLDNEQEEERKVTECLLHRNQCSTPLDVTLPSTDDNCYSKHTADYYPRYQGKNNCCNGGDNQSDLMQVCEDIDMEITSDMGHTDMDFEEMMSEMGPPGGMLTLIFNSDSHHIPNQPCSSSSSPGGNNQGDCVTNDEAQSPSDGVGPNAPLLLNNATAPSINQRQTLPEIHIINNTESSNLTNNNINESYGRRS